MKHLDELNATNFKSREDPYFTDPTLEKLQIINREAVKLELKEIEKLCKLAIGKRILNIELKKKRDEHNEVFLIRNRNY